MNYISIYNYYYYSVFSFIILYILAISSYAIDFIIINKKTEYWNKASDDEIIQKVITIVSHHENNIDLFLKNKQMFIKKVHNLNNKNLQFRIACYREGVKNRLNEIISKEKGIV